MQIKKLSQLQEILNSSDKRMENLCKRGHVLFYTRKTAQLCDYTDLKTFLEEKFTASDDLLEIHIFDEDTEYRAITSTSHKNAATGVIEHVVYDSLYDGNEKYAQKNYKEENILLETDKRTITVVNYLKASEYGMLSVSDYRMLMEV